MPRALLALALVAAAAACTSEQVATQLPPPHVLYVCAPAIFFDLGSASLSEQSKTTLTTYAGGGGCPAWQKLASDPEFSIIVSGYTDGTGSPEANTALSLRRAKAARDFLVYLGISPDRITVRAYGDTDLLAPTKGREMQNRRVVLSLARNGVEQHYF